MSPLKGCLVAGHPPDFAIAPNVAEKRCYSYPTAPRVGFNYILPVMPNLYNTLIPIAGGLYPLEDFKILTKPSISLAPTPVVCPNP